MVHVRIVAAGTLADRVMGVLERSPAVLNLVRLSDAASRPRGDLILFDVPREDASVLLAELRELGLEREGTIAIEAIESAPSDLARQAIAASRGSPADAVVWEQVEQHTSESAELSGSFLAFMVLATLIAGVGILVDSQVLIIGAMVVGPEFGPLAGVCIAIVERRMGLARRSLVALAVGFPAAIAATLAATLLYRAFDLAPSALEAATHPSTLFISEPGTFSIVVALLAGIAGVLSLTTAKSGALVGVLISVTTIPAAANVGVAAAYANWDEFAGALAQLTINLGSLVVAGVATLSLQRAAYARRRAARTL